MRLQLSDAAGITVFFFLTCSFSLVEKNRRAFGWEPCLSLRDVALKTQPIILELLLAMTHLGPEAVVWLKNQDTLLLRSSPISHCNLADISAVG